MELEWKQKFTRKKKMVRIIRAPTKHNFVAQSNNFEAKKEKEESTWIYLTNWSSRLSSLTGYVVNKLYCDLNFFWLFSLSLRNQIIILLYFYIY